MNKNQVLKSTPVVIVYLGFILYLMSNLNVLSISIEISYLVVNASPLFLLFLLGQLYLWQGVQRDFLLKNALFSATGLFFVNFYFLFDAYLAKILIAFFSIEGFGWVLTSLAVVFGVLLIVQLLFFLGLALATCCKRKGKKEKVLGRF